MRRLSAPDTLERLCAIGLEGTRVNGFTFVEDQDRLTYDFHTHTRHQLLYAYEGAVRLEVQDASFVLPPQRAAFIPSGVSHLTMIRNTRIASVYLSPRLFAKSPGEVRILAVTPLMRELILHAARWSPERPAKDRAANAFFASLAALCAEWLEQPVAARLPRGKSAEVRAAIDYLTENLATATLPQAAKRAATSERNLRRKLSEELGTGFRALLSQARTMRAMELLADPSQRITDVALTLGYDSLSAFAHTFKAATGELPSTYRARARG
jgi:AraC-like DNA-binding protein